MAKEKQKAQKADRAVFLDRDGTLNYDHGYTHRIEDLVLLPGVVEGLKILSQLGFRLFIISNQSGIGRGYYTEEDFWKFNNYLCAELAREGIHITKSYFAPDMPHEATERRKPGIGMLQEAANEFGIDPKKSYVIGDMTKDVKAGQHAGCRTILLTTGWKKGKDAEHRAKPDFVADNFLNAAKWIEEKERKKGERKKGTRANKEQHKIQDKIIDRERLGRISSKLKREGKSIVTVNGSFDLLHAGHVHFLKEAKKQGDILIVLLNSDTSIKKYKSKDRPYVRQKDRATLLAALDMVDYVTIFSETTPIKTLGMIQPNVHVNGEEYGPDCVEAPTVTKHGGRLHLVRKVRGLSTTKLVERIRRTGR